MTDTPKSLREELDILKKKVVSIETRLQKITPSSEMLKELKNISSMLKELKQEPSATTSRWAKLGIFLLGGVSFIGLLVGIGLIASL